MRRYISYHFNASHLISIFLFTDIMVYGFDVTGMTHTKLSQKLELETMVF